MVIHTPFYDVNALTSCYSLGCTPLLRRKILCALGHAACVGTEDWGRHIFISAAAALVMHCSHVQLFIYLFFAIRVRSMRGRLI